MITKMTRCGAERIQITMVITGKITMEMNGGARGE